MRLFAMATAFGALLTTPALAQDVTLRVAAPYGDESESAPVDYALARLAETMPEVAVELERIPQTDEYNTKVLAAAASGSLPDVLYVRGGLLEPLAGAGKLVDLAPALVSEGLLDRYNAAFLSQLEQGEGATLVVPDEASWTAQVFFNTAVFEQAGVVPPTSFDELLDATEALSAAGVTPLTLPMNGNWMAAQILDALVTRENPRGLLALQEGGRMADPEFRRAVERFKALVDAGLIGSRASAYEESVSLLTGGEAAMIMNGAWMMKDLAEAMPDTAGSLGLPFGDVAGQGAANASGGPSLQGYAASSEGEHAEIAARFAAWMAYYVAEAKVVERAYPSPFVDPAIRYEGDLLPFQQAYFDAAAQHETLTVFPWGLKREVDVLLEDTLGEFVTGSMSADEFVETIDSKLDRALR